MEYETYRTPFAGIITVRKPRHESSFRPAATGHAKGGALLAAKASMEQLEDEFIESRCLQECGIVSVAHPNEAIARQNCVNELVHKPH